MAELKKKWYGYEGIQEEDEDDKMPDVDQLNAWTANHLTNFRIAIEWLPREDERLVGHRDHFSGPNPHYAHTSGQA